MHLNNLLAQSLSWKEIDNSEFPYRTIHQGLTYAIRINDFLDEQLYSLLSNENNTEISFDDWPTLWERP